jgi:hypothetical protein
MARLKVSSAMIFPSIARVIRQGPSLFSSGFHTVSPMKKFQSFCLMNSSPAKGASGSPFSSGILGITELDVDVLPVAWDHTGADISDVKEYSVELNPYTERLPDTVQQQLTDRYVQLFEIFLEYRDTIARVTTWGTSDHESWKNGFPVRGRTNYPLLFDRNNQPKPVYHALRALKL